MKINWGTGIALFYTCFVITMVTFVVKSKGIDHSLVVENYYEEDLAYQSRLDKIHNSEKLEQDLVINQQQDQIIFQFPEVLNDIKGNIWFYRANDVRQDQKIDFQVDANNQFIFPTKTLINGLWTIKVDWADNQKEYYKEITLHHSSPITHNS